MRTLDSGIGTFPLPDSVTRASGRHIPKSESSHDGVTAGSSELDRDDPDPSQPDVKVPSLPKSRLHTPKSLVHSLSDPSVTCSHDDFQSYLRGLASSGTSRTSQDVANVPAITSSLFFLFTPESIRTKRSSLLTPRCSLSVEDREEEAEKKKIRERAKASVGSAQTALGS